MNFRWIASIWLFLISGAAISAGIPLSREPDNPFTSRQVAFARNAPLIASSVPYGIQIWETRHWTCVRTIPNDYSHPYQAVFALSPDGKKLATLDRTGLLTLAAVSTGQPLRSRHVGIGNGVLFTPDGGRLIVSTFTKTEIVDARTLQRRLSLPSSHQESWGNGNEALAVTPDSRHLLILDDHLGVATLWDLRTGKAVRRFSGRYGPIPHFPLAISPNGKLLATIGEDPDWHGPAPADAPGSPPGKSLYQHQMRIQIWDTAHASILKTLPGPMFEDFDIHLQFTADSRSVLLTPRRTVINLRTAMSKPIPNAKGDAAHLLITPDGDVLVGVVSAGATAPSKILRWGPVTVRHGIRFSAKPNP